ncbi:macrophage colony-stimulating factor 1 receptor 2 [Pleuronectes platessa]|uniref:macrophage colony-stimulating factor 1 receptor 2 n=1 Tax=Pleuronectes platessa TaxID=8262 RepID=UPI00232A69B9|nr:macrophage colony-stimulating factor 1 receptor 2 [Pleuronectes platessa]
MLLHSVLLLIALSCCCSAADPPVIRLNSVFLNNQTEKVLTAGTAFSLICHGNGSVHWSSTAFRFPHQDKPSDVVEVRSSVPRHTGTYRCGYTDRSLEHLNTWIHLYITDPSDPSSGFVTRLHSPPNVKEGLDFLFRCLPTDPSITNLTLQSEGSIGDRGQGLPQGMNVTFDPRRGALIRDVQRSFNGRYVCSGWKDGRQVRSRPVDLLVVPRLHHPPCLSVSQDEVVRLKGEKFEVTCLSSNPSHFYNLTWTHTHIQSLNKSTSRHYGNQRLSVNSTVSLSAVEPSHSGTFTCTAVNEAGAARATTQLRVLERPFLIIYLQPSQHANANTRTKAVEGDLFANVSSMPTKPDANISSGSLGVNGRKFANVSPNGTHINDANNANTSSNSKVEVHEGRDVTLTFMIEAYPPIRDHDWTTHITNDNNDTLYQESYSANGYRSKASLLLRRVRQEDRGRYSFHYSNSFFSGSQNVDLRIYRSPSAQVSLQNDTLTCSSVGYPLPTILWYTCPGVRDTCGDGSTYRVPSAQVTSQKEEEAVRTHLPLPADNDVTVECVAFNELGESRQVFSPGEPPLFFTLPLIGALTSAAVLLLLLLVVSYKWRQKPKYEIRWKIIESTDGNSYTFVDPTQLPYNHKWEFPRDKLRLGAVLGSGAFGKVVEATAYGMGTDDNVTRVAVKMLKPSAHSEEREALMSELKILSHLGYHDNIVNLLGACTRGGPMLMITEYCSHGDLLNFLRAHAHDFMTSVLNVKEHEDEVFYKNLAAQNTRVRSDSGISCCSEYQEMLPVQTQKGVHTDSLSVRDLMAFSLQVAQGLDFLSDRNCIHRDVAARNVLLTHLRVAKICDFGLARDIHHDDSYIVQGNARLPVKWMAPESIFQCVYTLQSDVWSYGVLLWEIFSLGRSPYPSVAVDTNFYKMIKDGRHMSQPDFAPAEMYQLMMLCWSLEPAHRPTFKTIGQLINRLFPSTNDKSPHHSHQVTAYRNVDEFKEEEEQEEEEVNGEMVKRGEEEESGQRERRDDGEEEETKMKNIYQSS